MNICGKLQSLHVGRISFRV